MRFPFKETVGGTVVERLYCLVGRDVYFGLVRMGSLPESVPQPESASAAAAAWQQVCRGVDPKVVILASYRKH